MIKFEDYPILNNHLSTLKDTSIDFHDQDNIQYMTNSERKAVNFDDVKGEYIEKLSLVEVPKSNDALFMTRDKNGIENKNKEKKESMLIFVEFKNGFMDGKKKFDVRKKIYDSVIILTDILDSGISKQRDQLEYILVYNEDVNKGEADVLKKASYVQPSKAYDALAKTIFGMAKKEYVCFNIDIFKNYCFKDVHTYTEKEFEEYLERN
mgnify:CR=1 FL=1